MQRFQLNGTGKFLDSVLVELLNQLDQSVKSGHRKPQLEKTWNYFVRIASILWRKSLIAPMTVHWTSLLVAIRNVPSAGTIVLL